MNGSPRIGKKWPTNIYFEKFSQNPLILSHFVPSGRVRGGRWLDTATRFLKVEGDPLGQQAMVFSRVQVGLSACQLPHLSTIKRFRGWCGHGGRVTGGHEGSQEKYATLEVIGRRGSINDPRNEKLK